MSAPPNPGSIIAREMGCTCPVIDNGHGRGWMGGRTNPDTGETLFVYTCGCPVHAAYTAQPAAPVQDDREGV